MKDIPFLIFGIVFAIVGALVIFFKLKIAFSCRKKVNAEITSVKSESVVVRGSTMHLYRPVFKYEFDGKNYKGEAPFNTPRAEKYQKGDRISIMVNPKNPDLYDFRGRIGLLVFGLIMLAIGLLFIVLYFY